MPSVDLADTAAQRRAPYRLPAGPVAHAVKILSRHFPRYALDRSEVRRLSRLEHEKDNTSQYGEQTAQEGEHVGVFDHRWSGGAVGEETQSGRENGGTPTRAIS